MKCTECKHEFQAANQHSMCPMCGHVVGTQQDNETEEQLTRVVRWFDEWEDATQIARSEAHRDRRYYDGQQWTSEEIAKLERRNQAPIVINRIFKKINYLLGQEVRNRVDPKAFPRTPAHDEEVIAVTDALRYVCDVEDFDNVSSKKWESTLIEGYGGCVVEHRLTPETQPLGSKTSVSAGGVQKVSATAITERVDVALRFVPWDRCWYDTHSREADFSDAAYLGLTVWMDHDDALREYGERDDAVANVEQVLEYTMLQSQNRDDTHDDRPRGWAENQSRRKRVRIAECYYRKGDDWYVCHYTQGGFLVEPKPTGYLDEDGNNTCPLVMGSAFVDQENRRYGVVRHMIGPQDEINHRRSKWLHQSSVRQVLAEDGAVLNPDEARTELAKPDGFVKLQRGALTDGRFQINNGQDMAAAQAALLAEAKAEIDAVGPDSQGLEGAANESGRALMVREQIGSLELARVMDNHKRWKREVYRQIWYRIRQFWPEERWVRVRDDAERTGFRFVGINRNMTRGERLRELLEKDVPPESALKQVGVEPVLLEQAAQAIMQQAQATGQELASRQMQQLVMQQIMALPMMQEPITANDVAHMDVDIVIDETPDTTVLQSEEAETIANLVPSFLQANMPAQPLLEMVIELSQLRSKRKLLDMLRRPNDPRIAEQQQQQQQMQMAQMQAAIANLQAQAQTLQTQAMLNQAKALETQAKTAETQANTQMGIPAEAQKDMALAERHAMEARVGLPAEAEKDKFQALKASAEAGEATAGAIMPDVEVLP